MPLIVTTRSSLPTGVDRQTVRVGRRRADDGARKTESRRAAGLGHAELGRQGLLVLQHDVVVGQRRSNPAPNLRRRRISSPSADAHSLMSALRLMASLRATWAAATRLFANPFSLADNVASLKFGTANATRTASTAIAIISSTSVKPPQRRSARPAVVCCNAGCSSSLPALTCGCTSMCRPSAGPRGPTEPAPSPRAATSASPPIRKGTVGAVVERHHARHRGRRQAAADHDLVAERACRSWLAALV